VVKGG
jgi:hypothetical protein